MRWLITGGCGFIGTGLIQELLKDPNNKIIVVDNLSVGSLEQLSQVCDVVNDIDMNIADLREAERLIHCCKDIDVIVHLAALSGVRESVEHPREWFENNVIGTFNILEAARINNVKRVVCASSSASVGDIKPPIHEDMPMKPISPYGASKSFMENFASAYYHSYGMDTVCLRFSNVYGPLSETKESLVAKFIRYAVQEKTFEVYGDGNQTRDFIHLYDLIGAIKKAAIVKDIGGNSFQLSSGVEMSVNTVIDRLDVILLSLGHTARYKNVDPKIGDIRTNWADNTKAKAMLGWEPEVDLNEGLKETVNWFIDKFKRS